MNNFLQTRVAVDAATKYLQDNALVESGLSCKNWEISEVIPHLRDGNIIDLGSDGSVVLPNVIRLGLKGVKVGIDLAYAEDFKMDGVDYIKGDLVNVPFPDGFFKTVVSLSTIEHQVDLGKFAKECSRLLSNGGLLIVSFDYWKERLDTSKTKLYSLDWNVLNREDVERLIFEMGENNMTPTGEIDWTINEAVINSSFCSPGNFEYTFGILSFLKVNL